MKQRLAHIALVVRDYEEAIAFYTQVLGFELLEDTPQTANKRWVMVSPKGDTNCTILLAKAKNEAELSRVGNQTGGRVFLFLHTDNFDEMYLSLQKHQVNIIRPRTVESFGIVAVFEDLYGNLWDLIQPK